MIYLKNISLSFADRKLFDQINWTITEKSRIGLVGDNGMGKTTLLRMIAGQVEPEEGAVEIPERKKKTIGYLPQDLAELEPLNLLLYLKKKSGIYDLEEAIGGYEEQISGCAPEQAEHGQLLTAYESALALYSMRDGYSFEARAKQIMKGLGFREGDFAKNCAEFSGGWKMRILLAVILLSRADIMLLDEPTNHLDTESMEWLESYLKDYPGTIIAVSHDRVFLDKIVKQIADLADRRLTLYSGNYSTYLSEKEKRLEILKKEMAGQGSEMKRMQDFVERFRYKATKARQVQSRLKMLEKFETVRAPEKTKTVTIKFPPTVRSGRDVVTARRLSKSYGALTIFEALDFTISRGEKIALVGINGAGKSTLLRLLSKTEQPAAGDVTYGLHVKMAFFSQESAETLNYGKTVWEEINAAGTRSTDQDKRNLLGAFLFSGSDINKEISVLSGGEKSRLKLLKVLLSDANLLILDEPTNHLDLKTKAIFQEALLNYHGTVIIVSHDRYFLDCLITRVIELRDGVIRTYSGNYSYFIEKRKEWETTPAGNGNAGEAASPAKPGAAYRTREEKKLEAEERNRLYKIRSALKKELSALEGQITALEEHKRRNEALLCESDTHRDPARIKALNRELKTIASELEELYPRWEQTVALIAQAEPAENSPKL
ncbi:MAG: ABC-F family ATP-binding cassette domain-containing protein [Deltaproteobacteria bacterium]|nr:ABC-F family ATP-binding cassette domain-containing protein [Deltaproteobacteria bacterium]